MFKPGDIVINKQCTKAGKVIFCFGNLLVIESNYKNHIARTINYKLIERNYVTRTNKFKSR